MRDLFCKVFKDIIGQVEHWFSGNVANNIFCKNRNYFINRNFYLKNLMFMFMKFSRDITRFLIQIHWLASSSGELWVRLSRTIGKTRIIMEVSMGGFVFFL